MPVTTEIVTTIVCDNPNCPGNTLDSSERVGWTFVNREVYGQTQPQDLVFCSVECSDTLSAQEPPPPLVLNPPQELPPPEPG